MRIFVKIALLFLLLSTSSCRWFTKDATNNFLRNFKIDVPPGSPMFKKGFETGCSQVLYARGNFFYRMLFDYHYDTSLNYNKEYRFGYKRGGNACFLAIISSKTPSFDKLLFPMGGGNDMGTGFYSQMNYDDTSGMFGGILNDGIGGDVGGIVGNVGGGGSVLDGNPIWAGNSQGQIFGQ